jgi:hypothetical protein
MDSVNPNVTADILDTYFDDAASQFATDDPDRGQAFGTIAGNIGFDAFGEAASVMWNEANPDIPMYRAGSADADDTTYPHVTWSSGGKKPSGRTPLGKHKRIETYKNEKDEQVIVLMLECSNSFVVQVKSNDSALSAQISRHFEEFMFEFLGALMGLGISNVFYEGRRKDEFGEIAGRSVTTMELLYTVMDQQITHVKRHTIQKVEMVLQAITEDVRT